MPEDDPAVFALFVKWLYVGSGSKDGMSDEFAVTLTKAWTLGDKLGCTAFQDAAMLSLIKNHTAKVGTSEVILLAYVGSAAGSKLRQYAIDQFRGDAKSGGLADCADERVSLARDVEEIGMDLVRSYMTESETNFKIPSERKEKYLIGG